MTHPLCAECEQPCSIECVLYGDATLHLSCRDSLFEEIDAYHDLCDLIDWDNISASRDRLDYLENQR